MDQAVEKDDFIAAEFLGKLSLDAAREAKRFEVSKRIVARNKEVRGMALAYANVHDALLRLKGNPVDPEANLEVGRYYCFVKGDWDWGLPMLALGNDPTLKQLAIMEIEETSDPQDEVRLGDGWWELAENEEGVSSQQLRLHAVDCYRRAQRDVSGLTREKLEKRIDEVVSTSQGVTLGAAAPIQLVPQEVFSIRGKRRLHYKVRVPKIASGKGVLAIGVAHMVDGTGDGGMYVNLINYNGRIVMRRFGKAGGWLWFGHPVLAETDWVVVLEDTDSSLTSAHPGNGGEVQVKLFPLPK